MIASQQFLLVISIRFPPKVSWQWKTQNRHTFINSKNKAYIGNIQPTTPAGRFIDYPWNTRDNSLLSCINENAVAFTDLSRLPTRTVLLPFSYSFAMLDLLTHNREHSQTETQLDWQHRIVHHLGAGSSAVSEVTLWSLICLPCAPRCTTQIVVHNTAQLCTM